MPVDGGRVVLAGAREGLVRPPGAVPAESIRIHGLREIDLAGAPEQPRRRPTRCSRRWPGACSSPTPRGSSGRSCAALRSRGARLRGPVVDTRTARAPVARRARRPHAATLSLGALATALGLPVHRPHRAAGDALTTAQAFIALATLLGDETVRSLASAQQRLQASRLYGGF